MRISPEAFAWGSPIAGVPPPDKSSFGPVRPGLNHRWRWGDQLQERSGGSGLERLRRDPARWHDEHHLPAPDRCGPRGRSARRFRDLPAPDDWRWNRAGSTTASMAGLALPCRRCQASPPRSRWRSCCRSISAAAIAARAISFKHGLAARLVVGLVAFVVYDVRHAALAYLGINPTKPAVEFEIRLPKAALRAIADTQVELLTDRNQKLAKVQDALAVDSGRPQRAQGNRDAGLPHHRPRGGAQSAREGANASSGCGCRQARRIPMRSARGISPTASRSRTVTSRHRDAQRLRDPLPRALSSGASRSLWEKGGAKRGAGSLSTSRVCREETTPHPPPHFVRRRPLPQGEREGSATLIRERDIPHAAPSRFKHLFKQLFKQPSVARHRTGRPRLEFHYSVATHFIIGTERNIP